MMKKVCLVFVWLLSSMCCCAQWVFQPTLSLGSSGLYYASDTPYGITGGGGFVGGVDAEFSYDFNEVFFLQGGTGIHYTKHVDSLYDGRACWLPIYAGGRMGDILFLEGFIGYNIPIGSSSIGYVHGWFVDFGAGMNLDPLLICLNFRYLNAFGGSGMFYVPQANLPIESGFTIGVKIKIRFPLNDD